MKKIYLAVGTSALMILTYIFWPSPKEDHIPYCRDVNIINSDSLKKMSFKRLQDFNLQMQAVSETPAIWSDVDELKVYFMDGSLKSQSNVLRIANHWSRYANISFSQVQNRNKANVRVSFRSPGYWAYDRINLQMVPLIEPTLSLEDIDINPDTVETYRVTLHEFGHLLSLMHEHQSINSSILWNKPFVYAYYKRPPNNWDKDIVDAQVFQRYQGPQYNSTSYDSLSIMHYAIPPEFTLNNYTVGWNNILSKTDKEFISKLYPNKTP